MQSLSLISMLYDGVLYIESSGLTFRPVAASVVKGHQAGNQTCKKMSSLLSERICVWDMSEPQRYLSISAGWDLPGIVCVRICVCLGL